TAPIAALVAADIDANGEEEIYTAVAGDAGVIRWTQKLDGWSPETLATDTPTGGVPWLAASDLNGDGTLQILHATSSRTHVIAADGSSVAIRTTSRGAALYAGSAPESGPSFVFIDPEAGPSRAGPGSGRHAFVALDVAGRENAGQEMRTNASGIGASLAVRVESRWTMLRTLRSDSGPGQSLGPLMVGLGGAAEVDFVSINWPDGVLQTEMHLAAGERHLLTETQRQMSSCPVIFAWDGEKYAFVSDILGVGGIGFAVGRDEWAPSRPRESFLMPAGLPAARNGRLELCIGEPMEEACYLDAVRLVAYDLPPGWAMTLDERFALSGPEPTGEPRFYRTRLEPVAAMNDRGEDVLGPIAETDLVAAPVGELDRRFLGRLAGVHALTIEFATPLDEYAGSPLLVANGWIEYPYSQTMFSAWQAGATYDAVSIDAGLADGTWMPLLESFGYMAGMPREMSIALEGLPAGTTALRLRTNQEIYWDALAVVFAEECPEAVRRPLDMVEADLRSSGFAHREPLPQRLPTYDHTRRVPLWDTRHQPGHYTRFGQVDDLLASPDDAIAIFGPGEEIELAFTGPPALRAGWSRRVVVEAEGWCKDRDLLTRDGATLGPLPARRSGPNEVRERLHGRFNTRYESGG
ncbi:MAG: ASPIC/UnbV domain-containing protein, partial [Planctomycetota bacterium]